MQDRVGQQFGSYRLVSLMGQGGFADVYLAQHLYLERQAAIKILQARLSQQNQEAFLKEARTIADLVHPNIIRVLDFGVEGTESIPFLVMDYAPNGSLRQRYPLGTRLHLNEVITYVKQIASALQYAHERKIVHRDVKPENVLLGQDGSALLSDFGIAVISQTSRPGTQDIHGTAAYMAPEQLRGHPQPASDQYALAMTAYELLCGELPFKGVFAEVASQQLFEPVPPLRAKVPQLPTDVERIILTALSKDPQQRFATIQAFANALAQGSVSSSTVTASSVSNAMTTLTPDNPQVPPPPPGYIANIPTPPPPMPGLGTFGSMGQQMSPPQGSGMQSSGGPFGPATYGQPPSSGAQQTPQMVSSPGQPPISLPGGSMPVSPNEQTTANSPASQPWNASSAPGTPPFAPAQYAATGDNRGAFPVPPGRPDQPKNKGGRTGLIVIIALLVVVLLGGGGVGAYFAFINKTPAPNPTTTPTAASVSNATPTPDLNATATASALTSTGSPTVAVTPTPPASGLPCNVDINTWAGASQDWVVHNGVLYNDGTNTNNNGPTRVAPCSVGVANYAVEAKIQLTNASGSCFGIVLRASQTQNGWQGYKTDVCHDYGDNWKANISVYGDSNSLKSSTIMPGTTIHTYRAEVKDNVVNFLIDGNLVDTATDNRLLTTENGEQVGLYSQQVQIQVTSFQVLALS